MLKIASPDQKRIYLRALDTAKSDQNVGELEWDDLFDQLSLDVALDESDLPSLEAAIKQCRDPILLRLIFEQLLRHQLHSESTMNVADNLLKSSDVLLVKTIRNYLKMSDMRRQDPNARG